MPAVSGAGGVRSPRGHLFRQEVVEEYRPRFPNGPDPGKGLWYGGVGLD